MSSFIVSKATVDAIVSFIFCDRNAERWQRILSDHKVGMEAHMLDEKMLGNIMVRTNYAAFQCRYQESRREVPPRYTYQNRMVDRVQAYKAIQCWIYQCAEGEVADEEACKALKEIEHDLAADIINDLPAYDAAAWDIRDDAPRAVSLMSLVGRKG